MQYLQQATLTKIDSDMDFSFEDDLAASESAAAKDLIPSDEFLDSRRESESLFLFKNDTNTPPETDEERQERESERLANQKLADELADKEQHRRIQEVKDRDDELEVVRQINIEYSTIAAQEEQDRRVREYDIAKVQEQLLRERSKSAATEMAEQERQRRLEELQSMQQSDEQERTQKQELVVKDMEKERERRLSLPEYSERAPSSSSNAMENVLKDIQTQQQQEDSESHSQSDSFSEIPVVHASSTKILLDEHTEWRCFVSSDNPEQESANLRALRMSLEEDLKEERHAKYQELVGDIRLLRFLRGYKMNVSIAATRYREMMELRKKYNLNDIRDDIITKNMTPDEFPHFQKIIPHLPLLNAYDLTDIQNGHVFYFEMSGYADFHGLVEQVTDEEWQTFFFYEMEYRAMKLDQLSRQSERLVQTIFVRDLTGFSIARFHPRLLKRLLQTISLATRCYPETTYQTLILHTPWIFHKVWNAIMATLHESQLKKIHMDGQRTFEHLVELLGGRDRLPKLLGGKNTQHAIPQTGFLGRNSYILLCEDGATQAEIRAGGKLQLPFRMAANDTICWEYEVKAHDIDFSVNFRTQGVGGAEEVEKIPKSRTACGETVANSFTASEDGIVVLSWDNSFSWTRGKTVAYKANVVKATHDFSCLDISGNDCV